MHEEIISNSSAQQPERRYAGFWMRFWAYLADLLIVSSINGMLLIPFRFLNHGESVEIGFWTITGIIGVIVSYLYFLFMTKAFHQTLGKMIFGLKVVREDSEPLKWNDLFFREVVGRFIHRVFFVFNLFYIVVAVTEQKQGIHDIIGNTRVVFDE